jgi:hypothetical protein
MKKFLQHCILFSIFTASFYIVMVALGGRYAHPRLQQNLKYKKGCYGHLHTRLKEAKTTQGVDILFLGSSLAYRGFDTRIFADSGITSFNLGSSAQTPLQTLTLIKRYLDSIQPKKVVYEVYPATFTFNGLESALDIIANDKIDFLSYQMAFRLNDIVAWNTLIYGHSRDLLQSDALFEEPAQIKKDTYIAGGYVARELEYFASKNEFENDTLSIKDHPLSYFTQIVEEIKKRDIELILVFSPVSQELYQTISFPADFNFDSLMSQHASYYNFNELMTVDDSLHFYDGIHLNQEGVQLFNQNLIKKLKQNHYSNIQ